MPKLAKPLADTQVRTAKPKEKSYTLPDGGGMYLEISPVGSKIWRMSYRQENGKQNRLTFGAYPEVSLIQARAKEPTHANCSLKALTQHNSNVKPK